MWLTFRAILYWMLNLSTALFVGEVVALLTERMLGHAAAHLPGGSLAAGMQVGMWVGKHLHIRPLWLSIVLCALCGIAGWAILLPSM